MISTAPKPHANALTCCIEAYSPPQVNVRKRTANLPLSRCKSCFQFISCYSFVVHCIQEQDLSETPAPVQSGQSAPVSTVQVLPSQSGSEQSTSAPRTARVPSAAAPLTLSDEDLQRIVEELHQRMNTGSQLTSTPKRG